MTTTVTDLPAGAAGGGLGGLSHLRLRETLPVSVQVD